MTLLDKHEKTKLAESFAAYKLAHQGVDPRLLFGRWADTKWLKEKDKKAMRRIIFGGGCVNVYKYRCFVFYMVSALSHMFNFMDGM